MNEASPSPYNLLEEEEEEARLQKLGLGLGLGSFDSIPHNVVNMRTGEELKTGLTAFTLQDKERLPFPNGAKVLPGNVIAVPKLDSVQTNDILTVLLAIFPQGSSM